MSMTVLAVRVTLVTVPGAGVSAGEVAAAVDDAGRPSSIAAAAARMSPDRFMALPGT